MKFIKAVDGTLISIDSISFIVIMDNNVYAVSKYCSLPGHSSDKWMIHKYSTIEERNAYMKKLEKVLLINLDID